MSQNIEQIYTTNPITSNASTDLMYFGQSPYTAGNDAAMTYANFAAQFGTPYTPAALTKTNDTNVTLTLGGAPGTALLQAVSITAGWTGELSLARGGTNASLAANNGGIFYSTASAAAILSGTATANQVLLSGSSSAPAWSTATYPATTTVNQLLYSSSANVVGGLATLDNGVLITSAAGVPELLANSGTPGYVLTANSGAPPSWQNITAEGAITTIDGDSGSITPSSGIVTISGGTTGLTTSGSGATLNLTGTLKLANGGTNADLTASNGGIFYSTASAGAILAGTATANQMLQSGASTTPAWSTSTWPATTTINQILYSSSANVVSGITTADNGLLITGTTGVPSILANSSTAGYVLTANNGAPASWQAVSASGAITTIDGDAGSVTPSSGVVTISGGTTGLTTSGTSATLSVTGTLKLANGGTNANLTASNGGIFYSTATAGAILAGTATAQQLLMSGSSTTPQWSTSTYPTTNAVNTLLYASSANVMAALATANSGVLITSNAGVPSWLANSSTAGYVLTANSGAPPSWQVVPTQDLAWVANANTTISAAVGVGYVLTAASATTVTLPTTFAVGQQIGIQGEGAAWTVDIGASTNVKKFGNTYTTSIASTNNTDSVIFIGIVANTSWSMLSIDSTGLTAS